MKKILILIVLICGALMSLTLPPVDKTKVPIKNVQGLQDSLAAKVNIATLESATDEFYNKTQSNARFINEDGDTITGTILVPTPAAGTNTTQAANMQALQRRSTYVGKLKGAGVTTILGTPWGWDGTVFSIAATYNMVDNNVVFILLDPITESTTVTSIQFYLQTNGSFTADNTNSVALYSYNGTTYTKVAESANDATIFNGGTGFKTVNLSSQTTISAGLYAVALLYNNSAQTTAPALATCSTISNLSGQIYPSSFKLLSVLSGQSTMPATATVSSLTATSSMAVVLLK